MKRILIILSLTLFFPFSSWSTDFTASDQMYGWNGSAQFYQTWTDHLAQLGLLYAPVLTSDQNYVSDAELVVVQATSGANTGDEDSASTVALIAGEDIAPGSVAIPGTAVGGQVMYMLEDTDNGSSYVGIGSPASNTNASSLIILLPTADPTTGQIITCAAPSSVTFSDGVARNAAVCTWTAASGAGDALVANPLSQFAATTSAQLAGVLSNETGSGLAVFGTSPVLITPNLGTPSALVLTNATGLPVNSVDYTNTTGSFKSLAVVTDSTADFLGNFTGANLYGGTFLANADDGDLVLPGGVAGMNFSIITLGAIQVVIEPDTDDDILLDGEQLDPNDSATNLSTAGDIIVFQYYDATGWLATSNGWTDED